MDNKIIKKGREKGREFLYLNTIIQMKDNKEVIIENCKKIVEYNDIFLELKTSSLILRIWGQKLMIDDYKTSGLIVRGIIDSIEFINKR